jgi:cytochrome b involved in lipid metabolism
MCEHVILLNTYFYFINSMKKTLVFLAAAVMLLGAGCSTADTTSTNNQDMMMTSSSDSMNSSTSDMNMRMDDPAMTTDTDMNITSTTPFKENNPDVIHAPIVKPSTSTTATTSRSVGTKTYTMADVKAANTAAKCWTTINGKVYDVTTWEDKHPGGRDNILKHILRLPQRDSPRSCVPSPCG